MTKAQVCCELLSNFCIFDLVIKKKVLSLCCELLSNFCIFDF
jgi:hypothetical protein